ncbi:MAG TPA: hypothetical protein PKW51_08220, partial [Methanoregulaceae archaeon]|nr:hypothetical protein [Methanoregulaceae archaeon]
PSRPDRRPDRDPEVQVPVTRVHPVAADNDYNTSLSYTIPKDEGLTVSRKGEWQNLHDQNRR